MKSDQRVPVLFASRALSYFDNARREVQTSTPCFIYQQKNVAHWRKVVFLPTRLRLDINLQKHRDYMTHISGESTVMQMYDRIGQKIYCFQHNERTRFEQL